MLFFYRLQKLNRFRINHGYQMLRESGQNVTKVCFATGINNQAYFYRQFKKLQMQSPIKIIYSMRANDSLADKYHAFYALS